MIFASAHPSAWHAQFTRNYIYNLHLFENKINPYIQDFAVSSSFRTQV